MTSPRRTTTQRGYGAQHKAERKRWTPIVNAGNAHCAETICLEEHDGRGRWIQPGTPWHLAHADGQRGYRGPAHERCNTAEAARRMHAMRKAERETKRLWWRP